MGKPLQRIFMIMLFLRVRSVFFCLAIIGFSLVALSGCTPPSAEPTEVAPVNLWESASDVAPEKRWLHPSGRRALVWAGVEVGEGLPGDDAAGRDVAHWRSVDREHRFDAVVVVGNWSEITPLLLHLYTSPDFYIEHVDGWGAVFRRGAAESWTPPGPDSVAVGEPDTHRATELSRLSLIVQAMGESRAALRLANAAVELTPDDENVRARRATLDLQRGRLSEAVAEANTVLDKNPNNVAALQIKAQALSRGGAADEAWQVAEHLVRVAHQNDMISLALHAQLASDARAFSREQESLERVVRLSEQAGVDPITYRVLLGQCYARLGLGRQAAEQFRMVQAVGSLPEESRRDVETALEKLKQSGF